MVLIDFQIIKSVLYRIETENGTRNYVGVVQRGRMRERVKEHLGSILGTTVRIEKLLNN